jgi:hypothetical protein
LYIFFKNLLRLVLIGVLFAHVLYELEPEAAGKDFRKKVKKLLTPASNPLKCSRCKRNGG